jgi:hypothetical protein
MIKMVMVLRTFKTQANGNCNKHFAALPLLLVNQEFEKARCNAPVMFVETMQPNDTKR